MINILATTVGIQDGSGHTPLVMSADVDPTAGGGVVAPLASVLLCTLNNTMYQKTSSGNTGWTLLGSGGGGGGSDIFDGTTIIGAGTSLSPRAVAGAALEGQVPIRVDGSYVGVGTAASPLQGSSWALANIDLTDSATPFLRASKNVDSVNWDGFDLNVVLTAPPHDIDHTVVLVVMTGSPFVTVNQSLTIIANWADGNTIAINFVYGPDQTYVLQPCYVRVELIPQ